jgi:triosephosphate isomerase (TIM)
MQRIKNKLVVAGNWKMNKSWEEARDFILDLKTQPRWRCTVIVNAPYLYLLPLAGLREEMPIHLGAQNCAAWENGAYTGEVSAAMLKSSGTDFVIIGHSERRAYFGETNDILLEKTKLALKHGLQVIFCCGETGEERTNGATESVVLDQLSSTVFRLSPEELSRIMIAYEPVWAIGTGLTASKEQAQEVHAFIRKELSGTFGAETAAQTPILYGGSCNPKNAGELFSMPDIDGGLIGGASLQVSDFQALIAIADQCIESN